MGFCPDCFYLASSDSRGPDFGPSEDSIIRVEASRLRKRLREYYATEGASHSCQLQLSESGYIPVFATRNGETAEAMAPPSDGASTSRDRNGLGGHTAIPAEGAAGGWRSQPRGFALRSRRWLLGLSADAVAFAAVLFAISQFAGVRQDTTAAAARDRSAVPPVSALEPARRSASAPARRHRDSSTAWAVCGRTTATSPAAFPSAAPTATLSGR